MLGVNPEEVYIADSKRGGTAYHTHGDARTSPAITNITPSDREYEPMFEERDECQ